MLDFVPEGLDDVALLSVIIGFLQPLVLDLLLQSKWSARIQALAAFVFSLVVALVTLLVTGALSGVTLVTAVLLISATSIVFYKGLWAKLFPGLKAKTDLGHSTAEPTFSADERRSR